MSSATPTSAQLEKLGVQDDTETEGEGKISKAGTNTGIDEIMSNRYNSDDADITLVSSDGITFKVQSYRLRGLSTVLDSMLSLAQNTAQRDPIVFSDPIIEHSSMLRALLDLIYDLDIKTFDDLPAVLSLIELGDKWDMPMVPKLVRQELRGRLQRETRT